MSQWAELQLLDIVVYGNEPRPSEVTDDSIDTKDMIVQRQDLIKIRATPQNRKAAILYLCTLFGRRGISAGLIVCISTIV